MRSLSRVVKGKKAVDVMDMYQFFSDFALEEETEEEEPKTEEEAALEAEEARAREAEEERIRAEQEEAERERASEILSQARQEAAQILEDARKQAELLREEAFEQGHEEGAAAGAEARALYRGRAQQHQKGYCARWDPPAHRFLLSRSL